MTIVYAIYSRNCIHLRETAKLKRRVDRYKASERKWGRPLNLSNVIDSLEVRKIFSLFVLKKHMLGFAQIISVFRTGWIIARVGVGYPVSGSCSRSSFCKWRIGACLF